MSAGGIKRGSAFICPMNIADVTFVPERMPKLQWLTQSGVNGSAKNSTLTSLSLPNGEGMAPPGDSNQLVDKKVILLPSGLGPRASTEDLLILLIAFVRKYCDIPPLWAEIIAHYCLMTWVFDKFTALPYLRFLGEPQTGKTRCLVTTAQLCYKSIIGAGATSTAALFRLMDVWKGTFVIDEADMAKGDLTSDLVKILNVGYMSGLAVLRCEKSGASYDPSAFDVFGPKVLSTRREFEDAALESRCLTLRTEDLKSVDPKIPRQLPVEFYSEALELRNMCLQWRMDNLRSVVGDQTELMTLAPRMTQITIPLWAISPFDKFKKDLLSFLQDQGEQLKSNSPLAIIAEALRQGSVNSTFIGPSGGSTVLSVKDIHEVASRLSGEWGAEIKFTPKSVGGLLRSLGLVPFRNRMGMTEFSISKSTLNEITLRHKTK